VPAIRLSLRLRPRGRIVSASFGQFIDHDLTRTVVDVGRDIPGTAVAVVAVASAFGGGGLSVSTNGERPTPLGRPATERKKSLSCTIEHAGGAGVAGAVPQHETFNAGRQVV
jgi:hypothetical protein